MEVPLLLLLLLRMLLLRMLLLGLGLLVWLELLLLLLLLMLVVPLLGLWQRGGGLEHEGQGYPVGGGGCNPARCEGRKRCSLCALSWLGQRLGAASKRQAGALPFLQL